MIHSLTYLEVRQALPSEYRNALDLYIADFYSRAKSKSGLGITADDVAVKYYERVMNSSEIIKQEFEHE